MTTVTLSDPQMQTKKHLLFIIFTQTRRSDCLIKWEHRKGKRLPKEKRISRYEICESNQEEYIS